MIKVFEKHNSKRICLQKNDNSIQIKKMSKHKNKNWLFKNQLLNIQKYFLFQIFFYLKIFFVANVRQNSEVHNSQKLIPNTRFFFKSIR